MRFRSTDLVGAMLVETDRHEDDRGYFARLRCSREFEAQGLPAGFVQTNLSFNARRGTFRGLHFQMPPSKEGKLVRCLVGAIQDLIVDLRPDSPTFLRHQWIELTGINSLALWLPHGFAHGFLTEADDTFVLYEMSDYYAPELSTGIRWDDPAFGISVPGEIDVIHSRDSSYPDLDVETLSVFKDI